MGGRELKISHAHALETNVNAFPNRIHDPYYYLLVHAIWFFVSVCLQSNYTMPKYELVKIPVPTKPKCTRRTIKAYVKTRLYDHKTLDLLNRQSSPKPKPESPPVVG